MKPIGFHVRSWESWALGHNEETIAAMPALLRRRVTPLGRQALSSAWRLPEAVNARYILSSRHGEFGRTLSLLEAVTKKEDLSPADFTLSVHHALIGLLSIAQHNHRGHTAVAAGQESFCYGLLEAIACLRENPDEPVVLIYFDGPLPGSFAAFNKGDESPIALALALAATGEGAAFQLEGELSPSNASPSASHAKNFLDFLASDLAEGISVGEHHKWRWRRHVAA